MRPLPKVVHIVYLFIKVDIVTDDRGVNILLFVWKNCAAAFQRTTESRQAIRSLGKITKTKTEIVASKINRDVSIKWLIKEVSA